MTELALCWGRIASDTCHSLCWGGMEQRNLMFRNSEGIPYQERVINNTERHALQRGMGRSVQSRLKVAELRRSSASLILSWEGVGGANLVEGPGPSLLGLL